jgi:hypothetical protein
MKNLIILILHILISWPIASLATSTNVNEVTDLFDKHIEGKQELLHNLEAQNNNAINHIKSGAHHDSIEGIGEAQVKASELSSIKETELDNAGRAKRASKEYQFYDENELEPDYTKPGNRLHKEDSDDIVSSTDDTMHKIGSNFMAKLNSEGFDCKTVKGSVVKEPTYYIEIKREQQKNTEYDQFFCEEPRNTYNCNDSVSMTCLKRGIKWEDSEYKEMLYTGIEMNNLHRGWLRSEFWKKSGRRKKYRGEMDAGAAEGIRCDIAATYQLGLEQVELTNGVGHGIGGLMYEWPCDKFRVYQNYIVPYRFRHGNEICEQWSEDWTERCSLK